MISKIKRWLNRYRSVDLSAVSIAPYAPIAQQDTRDMATKKRINKAFDQQEQQMNVRALKSHDPLCKDNFTCVKNPCFIRKPDKIVSTCIVEIPKEKRTTIKMGKYAKKNN